MIIFETSRLSVRRFTAADIDDLFAIYGDAEVMKYIRAAITKKAAQELLNTLIVEYDIYPHLGRYAVMEKQTGQYVGNFVLKRSEAVNGIEIGYAFLQAAWGRGFATELTNEGVRYAFETAGLEKLFAVTTTDNIASQRVLLKCGFTPLEDIVENGKQLKLYKIVNCET